MPTNPTDPPHSPQHGTLRLAAKHKTKKQKKKDRFASHKKNKKKTFLSSLFHVSMNIRRNVHESPEIDDGTTTLRRSSATSNPENAYSSQDNSHLPSHPKYQICFFKINTMKARSRNQTVSYQNLKSPFSS